MLRGLRSWLLLYAKERLPGVSFFVVFVLVELLWGFASWLKDSFVRFLRRMKR